MITDDGSIKKPTIHLCGSDPDVLIAGYSAAVMALKGALDALQNCRPNARDYFPQGAGAVYAADHEHTVRIELVQSVMRECYEILEHVADERDARKGKR